MKVMAVGSAGLRAPMVQDSSHRVYVYARKIARAACILPRARRDNAYKLSPGRDE